MKRVIITLILAASVISVSAQRHLDSLTQYRRSSLYSVLLQHTEGEENQIINSVFMEMPMPDKFNDHNLGVRAITSSSASGITKQKSKKKDAINFTDIESRLIARGAARDMVAKWFNRDEVTGICNHELIGERGLYDASQYEIAIADQTILGRDDLANNGMALINNTFMLVNDITFVNTGERTENAKEILKFIGGAIKETTGADFTAATDLAGDIVNSFDGYVVKISSYLYQLRWDDEHLHNYYNNYYISARTSDQERAARYEAFKNAACDTTVFKLDYVGCTTTSARFVSLKEYANKTKQEQFLIACTRAVDKSIVELQREHEVFKVNVPIYRINEDGTVDVQIGLKEGVNKKSKYQVLMPEMDMEGNITYRKIGTLAPVEDKIWDNRFGALEEAEMRKATNEAADEEAAEGNAYLDATTFKVVGAVDANKFLGCVVREEHIARTK